jgi:hypothetical protein
LFGDGTRWRVIEGFDRYAVSELGEVARIKAGPGTKGQVPYVLVKRVSRHGYHVVNLYRGKRGACSRKVHRLVCIAFHGSAPSSKHQVAHTLNNNRLDCRAINVRWATTSENQADKKRHGTDRTVFGEEHGRAKITERDVRAIRADPRFQYVIAENYGISQSTVARIKSREIWAHIP